MRARYACAVLWAAQVGTPRASMAAQPQAARWRLGSLASCSFAFRANKTHSSLRSPHSPHRGECLRPSSADTTADQHTPTQQRAVYTARQRTGRPNCAAHTSFCKSRCVSSDVRVRPAAGVRWGRPLSSSAHARTTQDPVRVQLCATEVIFRPRSAPVARTFAQLARLVSWHLEKYTVEYENRICGAEPGENGVHWGGTLILAVERLVTLAWSLCTRRGRWR